MKDQAAAAPALATPPPAPKARRVIRRPQAERSADTRAKLVDAAITCLHRLGYGATTVSTVAEEAGVSRGAMTHHFPAKTDLMLAVVREVFERDSAHYNRSVELLSPIPWMRELPSTMWDVISRPSAIAVIEIMLASRSDPELNAKLHAIQTQIDKEAHEWIVERVLAAGLTLRSDAKAIHKLFVSAVRGLAIEAVFMRNRKEVEKSIGVLREMMEALYPGLADEAGAAEKKTASKKKR
jgi:AcrR family transcriptional regulator